MPFAYELRKLDVESNYSDSLLNGCISPSELVDIICHNKFEKAINKMKVDDQYCYRIHVGGNCCITYSDDG